MRSKRVCLFSHRDKKVENADLAHFLVFYFVKNFLILELPEPSTDGVSLILPKLELPRLGYRREARAL